LKLKTGFSQLCHNTHASNLTSDNSPVITKDDKKPTATKSDNP
jgi:hypothetical protein